MRTCKCLLFILLIVFQSYGQDEFENIVNTIFEKSTSYDLVAIGERHWGLLDHELRLALLHDSRFSEQVNDVIIEFANSRYQGLLDEYVFGGDVTFEEVSIVWKNTTQIGTWDTPIYGNFIKTIRELNMKIDDDSKVRVIAGGQPIDWELINSGADYFKQRQSWAADRGSFAIGIIQSEVLAKGRKGFIFFGHGQIDKNSGQVVQGLIEVKPGSVYSIGTVRLYFGDDPYFIEQSEDGLPYCIELNQRQSNFKANRFYAFKNYGTLGEMLDAVICFGKLEDLRSSAPTRSPEYQRELQRRRSIRSELWQILDSLDDN